MGLENRPYYRQEPSNFRVFHAPRVWSINTWLILINSAVFLLQAFQPLGVRADKLLGRMDLVTYFGHFSTFKVTLQGGLEFWRFLTFQFLHGGIMHLVMNMLGLYMFGQGVEEHLGRKRYLAFYLVCGIAGGLMYLILNALGQLAPGVPGLIGNSASTPLIGASAGVFGVIMAAAYLYPNMVVQLIFPPISMPLKVLAYLYVAIALGTLIAQGRNAGGEAAHIGGAMAGFFFVRNPHLLRDFFDVFDDSRKPRNKPARSKPSILSRVMPGAQGVPDAEVDRIYHKIRDQGMQSLSDAEKSTLERHRRQKLRETGE